MKKISAVLCALLCLCFAGTAFAEETPFVISPNESITLPDVAIDDEDLDIADPITASEESAAESEEPIIIAPVSSEADTGRERGEYNLVSDEDVIVNYASSEEELPDIDILIWSVTGVLVLACLLLLAFYLIKKRRMR